MTLLVRVAGKLLRAEQHRLERRIRQGFDRERSLQLDRVLLAREALDATDPSQEAA